MTTIVFKDGVVAADRLVTERGASLGYKTKIVKKGGAIAAGAGSSIVCRQFTDWFLAGMRGNPPAMRTDPQRPASECVIYFGKDRFVTFDGDGVSEIFADHHTLGSGAPFARGALAAGADPRRAVEIAMQFDLYSGGAIDVLSL
ncbi:hypothetical protein CcrC1_gp097 [Caulobacter phage C1]|nr:hypothetical protein CcrC1_gp097 [Caulobacter phage C1]UTU08325.1 hypothetical protein CcrC2_gp097 [Caulobacter phage C2]UTU08845.1 hypothetical protein CcrJ4_gp094 [Caulobacter phage J4]UTU09399.1 hypothetical protein CcrBL47_gp113 [Caulobacter phage BL47]UTU09959.1 hypothetical protein CcrRB23_gp097 [Caulobacter phage RB23]WGN96984.1 hypothetical protein [Bertelyvirus sp.]